MPFMLPEYGDALRAFVSDAATELARAGDPILEQIEIEESPGAIGSVIQDQAGQDVRLEPGSVSGSLTLDVDQVRAGEPVPLILEIVKLAEQIADGQKRMLVSTLQTVTDATGNVVDAKGELTFETFYEMADKVEYSLTDDGELSLPTLLMHPETAAKLPKLTPEQEQQLSDLHDRKRNELLARRRSRRLS